MQPGKKGSGEMITEKNEKVNARPFGGQVFVELQGSRNVLEEKAQGDLEFVSSNIHFYESCDQCSEV